MNMKICAAVVACGLAMTASAKAEWSLADMNRTIEQTNFIVENQCSGTLISLEHRLVLTNHHCINHLVEKIEREVVNSEGFVRKVKQVRHKDAALDQYSYSGFEKVKAVSFVSEIVADSERLDLAVLKIKGEIPNVYASPMAKDVPTRGERIYTVGNPRMLEASVVEGVVSNVNRTFEFPWTGGEKTPIIQFSGGIIGGNSGGALYNAKGELIGVPAAMASQFIGLAIPMTTVRGFLKDHCLMTGDDQACKDAKAKKRAEKKDEE